MLSRIYYQNHFVGISLTPGNITHGGKEDKEKNLQLKGLWDDPLLLVDKRAMSQSAHSRVQGKRSFVGIGCKEKQSTLALSQRPSNYWCSGELDTCQGSTFIIKKV